MLLFYQIFNIALFFFQVFFLYSAVSSKREEIENEIAKEIPFKITLHPVYFLCMAAVIVYSFYLLAAVYSAFICLVVSWI